MQGKLTCPSKQYSYRESNDTILVQIPPEASLHSKAANTVYY